jgi:hypothetical protein
MLKFLLVIPALKCVSLIHSSRTFLHFGLHGSTHMTSLIGSFKQYSSTLGSGGYMFSLGCSEPPVVPIHVLMGGYTTHSTAQPPLVDTHGTHVDGEVHYTQHCPTPIGWYTWWWGSTLHTVLPNPHWLIHVLMGEYTTHSTAQPPLVDTRVDGYTQHCMPSSMHS